MAWTEPATGAEARSIRRWLRRAAAPRIVRYTAILALVVITVVLATRLIDDPSDDYHSCPGFQSECVRPPENHDILDWIF